MSNIGLEISFLLFLILASGVFTMAATAVVTARKSRLQDLANSEKRNASLAFELATAPGRFLSAVQAGITLIAIFAGAFGSRTIADRLAGYLSDIPIIGPYSDAIALAAVVMTIAYFMLVIGEFVPKRLASHHAESIASFVAVPMRAVLSIFAPVVYVLSLSTDLLLRIGGRLPAQAPPVTEEEIRTLVQKGTEAGIFEESEQEMLEAVFNLGDRRARSLMTPRTQIVWLDLNESPERVFERITKSGFSRFPVSLGGLDQVKGVVQAKDLLAGSLAGTSLNLDTQLQQPLFVPRSASALQVLELFKQSGKHIALVVDEYGGIEGLLTHHDILEAIAGEIRIGEKHVEPMAVQRPDGSWLLDGMLPVEQFKEIFQLERLPGEKKDAYQTFGGFLFTQMGRVPSVAESMEWGNLQFEIVDMDGKRIDKVLVKRCLPPEQRT